jgi:uncharacterized protein involved in outer membrane biogenesis
LILLPLAVLAAVVLSLPRFLNSADYKAFLIEQAESQLGRKVELGQAHVEVFPYVRVALDDVLIRDTDGRTPFVTAKRLFLDLRIFPLLRRKVIAKRILLDRPKVVIKRGGDGKLNVSDLFSPNREGGMTLPMLVEQTALADGQIEFQDAFHTDTVRTLTFRRVTTSFQAGARELNFKFFAAVGGESGQTPESTFNIRGQIVRVPIEGIVPGGKAQGTVEAKNVNLGQLTPFLPAQFVLSDLHATVDLTAAFEYKWAQADRTLSLKDMQIATAGMAVMGTADLQGLFSPQFGFTASLSTTPFSLGDLIGAISDNVLRAHSLGFLRDGQVSGTLRLPSMRITGSPGSDARLTVQGEMEILSGSALVGKDRVPVTDLKGLVKLEPDRADIVRLTGRYGLAEVTEGTGAITNLADNPDLHLDIKGKLTAQELAVIVARFAPKAVLPNGPLGLSGVQGGADAAVRLVGPLAHLDDLHLEWALTSKEVGFTDPRLKLPVTGLRGKVHSIPRGVAFDDLAGSVGKSPLALDGDIAVQKDEKTHYGLTISGQMDAQEALAAVVGGPTGDLSVTGITELRLKLSGTTEALRGTGRVNLLKTSMSHAIGLFKPKGLPGVLEFDALLDPGRLLKLDRVLLEIPPLSIQTKGAVFLRTPNRLALNVRVPPVSFRALPKGMLTMKGAPQAGVLQADIEMTGLVDNWRAAKLKGRAGVKHALVKLEGVREPVENLNLELIFDGDRLEIEQGSVTIKDSRINAKGAVRGWRGIPLLQVILDSPGLDLELVIPEGERSPLRTALEAIGREAKLTATATVRNGVYRGVIFDEIQVKASGGEGVFVLDPVTGRMNGGAISGQARVAVPEGKPAAIETSLHVDGVAVEPLFKAYGFNEPPFTGALKLDGAIRGDGGDPRGTSPTLNGDVRVMVKKGYFRKLSATSKIVGLMNLATLLAGKVDLSDKGMPFDCITGRVVVKNGIADIQNYLVESPIMKITGAGTYDIPNDRYDMVMVVTPFGSYEGILQSIPLFGKLFAGEREGFSTAFFEIKGSLTDPQVTWRPIKSVGAGLTGLAQLAFDVMKNLIMLPKEIVAPSEQPRSPCSAS